MRLFDEQLRTDYDGRGYAEGDYAYLNRSARSPASAIRQVLEDWFDRFPEAGKGDLAQRFRSGRAENHRGALLELWTSEVLQQTGFDISVHPALLGTPTAPDFGCVGNGVQLFAECTTAMQSASLAGAGNRRLEAADALQEVSSAEWAVHFNAVETGPGQLGARLFRNSVQAWLAGLDRVGLDATARVDHAPFVWERDGWRIELHAIPLKESSELIPLVGAYTGPAQDVEAHERLRRSVERKGSHYGADPGAPVLLVIVPGFDLVTDRSLVDALLGDRRWNVSFESKGVTETRRHNGAWVGANGLRGRRIPAVLYAQRFASWTLGASDWELIHHPAPLHVLPSGLVPFAREITWDGQFRAVDAPATQSVLDFLELPPDWPGEDSILGDEEINHA